MGDRGKQRNLDDFAALSCRILWAAGLRNLAKFSAKNWAVDMTVTL